MGTLTTAGLAKLAESQQTGNPFVIDQIIFADYPGLSPTATPPASTSKPTVDKIVHTATVISGFVNNDTVVYKATLLPTVGNFQFNWVGLYSSATDTLIAVNYQEMQTKNKSEGFDTGNIIVKTFSIQYTQVKELTGVTIAADLDSWDVVEILTNKAEKNHAHAEYANTTHAHNYDDLPGLSNDLSSKAMLNHSHAGYANTTHAHAEYANTVHAHAGYANIAHAHSYNDLPGLANDLLNKATLTHSHPEYAGSSHTHTIANIPDLSFQLGTKAHTNHSHVGMFSAGFIMYWDGSTPPAGFLELNGAELSKTAYAALYAVCGNRHGQSADGTKFKLRDARGEFIRCWDNGRGVDVSRDLNAHQGNNYQSHTHPWKIVDHDTDATDYYADGVSAVLETSPTYKSFGMYIDSWATANDWYPAFNKKRIYRGWKPNPNNGFEIGYSGADETRPRNIALMLVIKY